MSGTYKRPTLCWSCRNAVSGCSWAKTGKPVQGWTATPTKVRALDKKCGYIESFRVEKCPLYVED